MSSTVQLVKKLVSIPSVVGDEKNIIDYIASYLSFCNPAVEWFDDRSANIVAETKPEKRCIVLNAHIDTVPPVKGWQSNPYKPFLKGDNLYGLGAADMKGGLAIFLEVFKKAYFSNYKFNVLLMLTGDEEGKSKGSYRALSTISNYKPFLCLISEPTQERVMLGARGRYTVQMDVIGKSAHGAVPESGTNAISDAAQIVRLLKKLKLRFDKKLGYGSVCVLKIEGGTNTLSVPESCRVYVDRHYVRSESKSYILAGFREIVAKSKIKSKVRVRIMPRETPYLEPYLVPLENRYAKLFCTVYSDFYQQKPEIIYGRSVGDFNRFGKMMPTIVFGPKGLNWHAADEYVDVKSISRCRDFYLAYLNRLDAQLV